MIISTQFSGGKGFGFYISGYKCTLFLDGVSKNKDSYILKSWGSNSGGQLDPTQPETENFKYKIID